jgi:peptidoglycan/LPS O-acetylase OafA/YrhL
MVIAFHAGLPVPGGFAGVDVFFVISGFAITTMLQREWSETGSLRFPAFYARRFRRLTPALALMVSFTAVASALVVSPLLNQRNGGESGIGAMLLFANVVITRTVGGYFDADASTNPLLNTWSLSVEEQFYLAFPVILFIGWWMSRRLGRPNVAPYVLTGMVAGGSFAAALIASYPFSIGHGLLPIYQAVSRIGGFYSPFTRAWEFAAGALLALSRSDAAVRRMSGWLAWVGLLMIAASLWALNDSTPYPGTATLLPVTGAFLLILAGSHGSPVTRALGSRPLIALGDISYSLYLWHWPLIVFAAFLWPANRAASVSAAVISVVPAGISYRWVEQLIRSLKDVSPRRMSLIVSSTLSVPLAFCAVLLVAAHAGFWSSNVRSLRAAVLPLHAAAAAGCSDGAHAHPTRGVCEWNGGAAGPPIYVIGDSNAEQFSEAVIGAGRALRRPVTITTYNGCSLLGTVWSDATDVQQSSCRVYVNGVLDWLTRVRRGTVIIGMSDSIWEGANVAVGATRATETSDQPAKTRYLESEIESIAGRLRGAGQQVLLMQPVPKAWAVRNGTTESLFDPERCTTFAVLRGRCPKPVALPREYEDRLQAAARRSISTAAARTGSTVLDLRAYFCPGGTCSNYRGSLILYRDAGHLTVATSSGLAKTFANRIREMRRTAPEQAPRAISSKPGSEMNVWKTVVR